MSLYRLQYLNAPIAKAVATGRALYSVGIVVPLLSSGSNIVASVMTWLKRSAQKERLLIFDDQGPNGFSPFLFPGFLYCKPA